MKKEWTIWAVIIGVIIVILVIFNFQGQQDRLPVGELFPEQKSDQPRIEYEFVSGDDAALNQSKPVVVSESAFTASPKQAAKSVPAVSLQHGAASPQGKYAIQVVSHNDKSKAESTLKKVADAGYSGYIATVDLGQKGVWHRVYVGPFATKEQANETLGKVKATYKDSFVIVVK